MSSFVRRIRKPLVSLPFSEPSNLIFSLTQLSDQTVLCGTHKGDIKRWKLIDSLTATTTAHPHNSDDLLVNNIGSENCSNNTHYNLEGECILQANYKGHSSVVSGFVELTRGPDDNEDEHRQRKRSNFSFASCSYDQTIRLWHTEPGVEGESECVATLRGHMNIVYEIRLIEDKNTRRRVLASCSFDRNIRLWDLETLQCTKVISNSLAAPMFTFCELKKQQPRIVEHVQTTTNNVVMAASSTSTETTPCYWLVSGCYNSVGCGLGYVWNASDGRLLSVLRGHNGVIRGVVELNNGLIATCSNDATIKLWRLEVERSETLGELTVVGYQCSKTLEGHSDIIFAIVLMSQSRWFATGSRDQTIRGWDEEGNAVFCCSMAASYVIAMNQLSNGMLACALGDGRVEIWKVIDSSLVDLCCTIISRHLRSTEVKALLPEELYERCSKFHGLQ